MREWGGGETTGVLRGYADGWVFFSCSVDRGYAWWGKTRKQHGCSGLPRRKQWQELGRCGGAGSAGEQQGVPDEPQHRSASAQLGVPARRAATTRGRAGANATRKWEETGSCWPDQRALQGLRSRQHGCPVKVKRERRWCRRCTLRHGQPARLHLLHRQPRLQLRRR